MSSNGDSVHSVTIPSTVSLNSDRVTIRYTVSSNSDSVRNVTIYTMYSVIKQ